MIDIAAAVRRDLRTLSPDVPMICLGNPFSMDEASGLNALNVSPTIAHGTPETRPGALRTRGLTSYNNFGALGRCQAEISRFFAELKNNDAVSSKAAATIFRFIEQSLAGFGQDSAWLTIRAFTPIADFDEPRWHHDGYYYAPFEGEQYKIVLTLKGAGTLFAALPEEHHLIFNDLDRIPFENPDRRRKIADAVDRAYVRQAELHEPYLYVTGAPYSAIHSEPPIHEDRLFMSLVPGTPVQIEELRLFWNEKTSSYE